MTSNHSFRRKCRGKPRGPVNSNVGHPGCREEYGKQENALPHRWPATRCPRSGNDHESRTECPAPAVPAVQLSSSPPSSSDRNAQLPPARPLVATVSRCQPTSTSWCTTPARSAPGHTGRPTARGSVSAHRSATRNWSGEPALSSCQRLRPSTERTP